MELSYAESPRLYGGGSTNVGRASFRSKIRLDVSNYRIVFFSFSPDFKADNEKQVKDGDVMLNNRTSFELTELGEKYNNYKWDGQSRENPQWVQPPKAEGKLFIISN